MILPVYIMVALLFMGNIIFFLLWRDEVRLRKTDKSSLKIANESYEAACKRAEDYVGKLAAAHHELMVARGRAQFIDDLVKVFQKHGVRV